MAQTARLSSKADLRAAALELIGAGGAKDPPYNLLFAETLLRIGAHSLERSFSLERSLLEASFD